MESITVTTCPACGGSALTLFLQVRDHRASNAVFDLVQCGRCALVITQNQPPATEISRYYSSDDYISHFDEGTSFMDRMYYTVRKVMLRKKASWIRRFAQGDVLLDIGAGTGAFVNYMRDLGWNVRGFEPNARARESAARTHGLRIEEIDTLFELSEKSVDAITMWHVLEHVHDPAKYLHHIHFMLKDQGTLFVALPNYCSWDARFYGAGWAAWDVPRHLWHFGGKAVNEIAAHTGFEVIHRYIMPFDAFYVSLVSEKYRGGGVLRQLRGLTVGAFSLTISLFAKNKASSIVYVCKKVRA